MRSDSGYISSISADAGVPQRQESADVAGRRSHNSRWLSQPAEFHQDFDTRKSETAHHSSACGFTTLHRQPHSSALNPRALSKNMLSMPHVHWLCGGSGRECLVVLRIACVCINFVQEDEDS